MTTTTDIANKALTRIGVRTFDNAVDAGTLSQTVDALTDLHETMVSMPNPVVNWELDAIPSRCVGPLVDELAWYIRDDFSVPDAKMQSLQAAQIVARGQLYAFIEKPDDGEPVQVTSF